MIHKYKAARTLQQGPSGRTRPFNRHEMRRASCGRSDTGATLVEYAMGVALVVVASLSAISFLADRSEEKFEARSDRAGNPDAVEAGSPAGSNGGPSGGTPSGPSGPATPSTPPVGARVANMNPEQSPSGSDWIATVSVVVNDDSDAPASGVVITGAWDPAVSGSTVSCTTGADGSCPFTQSDMKRSGKGSIPTTTFTVTAMSFPSSSPPVSYTLPSPLPSITITVK